MSRSRESNVEIREVEGFRSRYYVYLEGRQVGQWYVERRRAETIAGFLRLYADDVVFATLSDEEVSLLLKHRGIDVGPAFERVKAALAKANDPKGETTDA